LFEGISMNELDLLSEIKLEKFKGAIEKNF